MDNPVQEYEKYKTIIEEIKVKRISDLREKERLEKEFEELKSEIKETYGVEIQDFEKAINDLKEELNKDLNDLKLKIEQCKSQMEIE